MAFDCDKVGNIANLSRIDPTLLGVKDLGLYTKNLLYLHGQPSEALLCFSLVLVMDDGLEEGRTFGSELKSMWVVKYLDVVLAAVELERLVAVLGLAFKLPYVPDDSARRATDLLYFSMTGNAFSFTTVMAGKSGKHFLSVVNGFETYVLLQKLTEKKTNPLPMEMRPSAVFLHKPVRPCPGIFPLLLVRVSHLFALLK